MSSTVTGQRRLSKLVQQPAIGDRRFDLLDALIGFTIV
jgi:hypothetical protein